jgi:hypothetical protein
MHAFFAAWRRRVSTGLTLSPMAKNYLALGVPLVTGWSVLLLKYAHYEKKAAQVTILSGSKQWDKWCSESGSDLREEDKSFIRDLLADLEERKRTETLAVRMQRPGTVVILPTKIEKQRRN